MPLRVLPQDTSAIGWPATRTPADPFNTMLHSLAVARTVGVVARLGLFAELTEDPVRVEDLARRFALEPEPLNLMLQLLAGEGWLDYRSGGFVIAEPARLWLDPASNTSVTTALSDALEYWEWWAELEQVASGGAVVVRRPDSDDESAWLRRVRGRLEVARRIGEEVADFADLPHGATSLVDVGAAHGWYSAVLCKRNPLLRATVIDSAPAVAIGRELIWEAGMDRTVSHLAGDIWSVDLGGPHDAAICIPLVSGLADHVAAGLLQRIRAALRPGGLLITLRSSRVDGEPTPPYVAARELLLRLACPDDPTSPAQFEAQLAKAGFASPRTSQLELAPDLLVCIAQAC